MTRRTCTRMVSLVRYQVTIYVTLFWRYWPAKNLNKLMKRNRMNLRKSWNNRGIGAFCVQVRFIILNRHQLLSLLCLAWPVEFRFKFKGLRIHCEFAANCVLICCRRLVIKSSYTTAIVVVLSYLWVWSRCRRIRYPPKKVSGGWTITSRKYSGG